MNALRTNSFLTLDVPNIGCLLLFNHTNDKIKITVHLVNAISKRGID